LATRGGKTVTEHPREIPTLWESIVLGMCEMRTKSGEVGINQEKAKKFHLVGSGLGGVSCGLGAGKRGGLLGYKGEHIGKGQLIN